MGDERKGDQARVRDEVRGKNSVAKVEDALREHPELFASSSRSQPRSWDDSAGKDLAVVLVESERLPGLDNSELSVRISIEVKSGRVGTLLFLAGAAAGISSKRLKSFGWRRAVMKRLFERRQLVVMAGDGVQTNYRLMEQYKALREYWTRRSRGENTSDMLDGLFARFFGFDEKDLEKAADEIARARARSR